MTTSYLPINWNLPYLNCESFGNEIEMNHGPSTTYLPIPNIKLDPRPKRSRMGSVLSSSSQEHDYDDQGLTNYGELTMRRETILPSEEEIQDTLKTDDVAPTTLQRVSSSKSIISRRSSMQLTPSFSLQFNLSLQNPKSTSNSGHDNVLLSTSAPSILPTRNSIRLNRSSSQEITNPEDEPNREINQRRSPVTTTFDYLATSLRFPDVTIGLSI